MVLPTHGYPEQYSAFERPDGGRLDCILIEALRFDDARHARNAFEDGWAVEVRLDQLPEAERLTTVEYLQVMAGSLAGEVHDVDVDVLLLLPPGEPRQLEG